MPFPQQSSGNPCDSPSEYTQELCRRGFFGKLATLAFAGSTLALTCSLQSRLSRRDALLSFYKVTPALTNLKIATEILASSVRHFAQRYKLLSGDDRLSWTSELHKMGIKLRDICDEVGQALAPADTDLPLLVPRDTEFGFHEALRLYAQQLTLLNRMVRIIVETPSLHDSHAANARNAETLRRIGKQLADYGRALRDACGELDEYPSLAADDNLRPDRCGLLPKHS